ncbi:MAG TPA: metalloregulator ArsR/SmtB family transcription factor [Actinomycetota bacterium]
MTEERAARVFSALSDPTRRDVVRRLSEGASTATELAARLPVSRQAVAKHLSALAGAGLVSAERHGREVRYRLTPAPLADAVGWISDLDATWSDRLEALRRHLGASR